MSQGATPSERLFGMALLATLIAGLIAGISARIIMRIVALTAHQPPGFSIEGTLHIVFLGFFVGLGPGIVYAFCILFLSTSPKAKKYLPGPIWRGIVFGLLLVVIVGLPNVLIPSPLLPQEDLNLGNALLNRIMFAALPFLYGITLGGAEKVFDHYLPGKPTAARPEIPTPILDEEESRPLG